jgi:hypothetical protein
MLLQLEICKCTYKATMQSYRGEEVWSHRSQTGREDPGGEIRRKAGGMCVVATGNQISTRQRRKWRPREDISIAFSPGLLGTVGFLEIPCCVLTTDSSFLELSKRPLVLTTGKNPPCVTPNSQPQRPHLSSWKKHPWH